MPKKLAILLGCGFVVCIIICGGVFKCIGESAKEGIREQNEHIQRKNDLLKGIEFVKTDVSSGLWDRKTKSTQWVCKVTFKNNNSVACAPQFKVTMFDDNHRRLIEIKLVGFAQKNEQTTFEKKFRLPTQDGIASYECALTGMNE